jgi:hypothetical protein
MPLQFTVSGGKADGKRAKGIYRRERGDRQDLSILGFLGVLSALGGKRVQLTGSGGGINL